MKPLPQVGDIWRWYEGLEGAYTFVLIVEHGPEEWDPDRFICLQLHSTDPSWCNQSGSTDHWTFGQDIMHNWEFIA